MELVSTHHDCIKIKVGRQCMSTGIPQKGNGHGGEWCILAPSERPCLYGLYTNAGEIWWIVIMFPMHLSRHACWASSAYSSSDAWNDILHWWWFVQCEINTRWRKTHTSFFTLRSKRWRVSDSVNTHAHSHPKSFHKGLFNEDETRSEMQALTAHVVLLSDDGQWMSVTVSQCCASRAWPTHIQRSISIDTYDADAGADAVGSQSIF